jgi:hypothetical protein
MAQNELIKKLEEIKVDLLKDKHFESSFQITVAIEVINDYYYTIKLNEKYKQLNN